MKSKRFISLLLALAMCLSFMPITVMAAAPHQYLSDIQLKRSGSNANQVYLRSDALPYETFSFDPLQTKYDIMLVDADKSADALQIIAKLADSVDVQLAGGFSKSNVYINSSGGNYTAKGTLTKVGTVLGLVSNVKPNLEPLTVDFVTGLPSGAIDTQTFTETDTYTFNFYRKATLSQFKVAYEESGAPIQLTSAFDPYETNLSVENVEPGTKELYITAPAYTPADTTLKFDNGSGKFTEGSSASTFTLDLTKYEREANGSIIIPFVLDYDQEKGSGVDGHYTLTVSFGKDAVDYTPVFKRVSGDAEANIGDSLSLSVEVEALESDTESSLSYQWYSSASAEAEGGEIESVTAAVYSPPTDHAGTAYYTCHVTRTVGDEGFSAATEPIKVTVLPEGGGDQQGSSENGFVKDITLRAAYDNYIIFDDFKQDQTYYEVELPDTFLSRGSLNVLVAPESTALKHSLSVKSLDGDFSRYGENWGFYNKDVFDVTSMGSGGIAIVGEFTSPIRYGILDYLKKGDRYVFKINVHEDGKEEDGDVYVFVITYVPVVTSLTASAGDKSLPITPQPFQYAGEAGFNRDYYTTTNADEIALKGTLWQYSSAESKTATYTYNFKRTDETQQVLQNLLAPSAKFIYNGNDETESFTKDGVTIDLSKYEKDENDIYTIPFSIVHDAGAVKTQSDYKLHVRAVEAVDWTITAQPQGGTYDKGSSAVLSVETSANEGDVTYQWQYGSQPRESFFNNIPGAAESSFQAPTAIGGTRYYRCVITDKRTMAHQNSDAAEVAVKLGKVNAPVIVYQPGIYNIISSNLQTPYKTQYLQGEAIDPIQMAVGTTEGGSSSRALAKVTCKWYYNTTASTEGAVLLDSKNYSSNMSYSKTYDNVGNEVSCYVHNYIVPEALGVGEHYFYFVATAVSNADEKNTTSVTSDFSKITVSERSELEGFEGKGTESEPYLIKSVEDLKKIDEYVLSGNFLSGAVFKLANDIMLPSDWEPIGKDNGGKGINLLPFSGIIDGDNKTLTVAEGGKPLLEYARDAVVRNLNIYGAEINGAGLLDKVSVDYGTDGIYQQYTDPDVITMENVTLLSGSRTLGSGLANGGFNSGINDIIVKNCTIEDDVVVGYNKDQRAIGSFVGTLNGRIENSVSYATVYGTSNVGGLAGKKGQSMGDCEVFNSAFLGTIEATGGNVGGIIGAGYISESAPSTPPVTVRNCYVVADITGNSTPHILNGEDMGSGIGGIVGSEIGLLIPFNDAYISDNHFCGTITDTNSDAGIRYGRVGGILGEIGRYEPRKLTYKNNYYLKNDNYEGIGYQKQRDANWEPNKNSFIAKTKEEFADGTVTALLNQGVLKNWLQRAEHAEEDSPYPIHSSKPFITELELSGNYKTTYYIGEALNLEGMVITAHWSTGETSALALSDVEVTGYDNSKRAVCLLTLKYGMAHAETVVTVLQRETPGSKNEITVYFTLMGDEDHKDTDVGGPIHGLSKGGLQIWIPKTPYTININATAEDVFREALGGAGIEFDGNSDNEYDTLYISGVKSPVTGTWIEEFTNGPNSGWMFTVNGKHLDLGLAQQFLDDGDRIVFHYTDDWTKESDTQGWITGPGKDAKETTLTPKATASNGTATVSVNTSDLSNAIKASKTNGTASIVIAPEITGEAKKVSVDIQKASLSSMASDTDAALTVQTPVGSLTIPNNGLSSIATQASGATVTLSVESVKADILSAKQKKAVGDDPVYDISITSGGKNISSFGGESITISLPYALKDGQDPKNVTVWYLNDAGELEQILCTYDKKTGHATFTTTHLSKYLVRYAGEEVWKNPFTDVKDVDWFYGAVEYASKNGLFNGTTTTAFEPNTLMSRAMFATVLYRLEGLPAVTGTNRFKDVKNGEWYTDAVIWADVNGIIGGYDNGLFGTTDSMTRQQMATILYRYAKYKGYNVTKTVDLKAYTDTDSISGYAQTAILWANAEGLLTGRTATTLAPTGSSSRAEVATVLMRFMEKVAK